MHGSTANYVREMRWSMRRLKEERREAGASDSVGNLVGGRRVLQAPALKYVQPGGDFEWGKEGTERGE
jgi:hypothetical protein